MKSNKRKTHTPKKQIVIGLTERTFQLSVRREKIVGKVHKAEGVERRALLQRYASVNTKRHHLLRLEMNFFG